jgi:aspartyl-tRNA(Asn)/glutamyl-tRNA(Gln) amidotransferase subunit A
VNDWPAVAEIAEKVNQGEITAAEMVERSLSAVQHNREFQAIISTTEDRAKRRASQIDAAVKSGKKTGRLAGVPFIAKDNFLTLGSETTAASNILRGFEAPYQATAIDKLEAEGAINVAKANLDAFAHGSSTENSDFFVTKNPHDKTRVPGGSSGGSASAVALNMAPFALGTDTGGSVRLPASFCGLVGYKPSYGRISRSGIVAMASSTDVVGPITKTVADAALVVDVMSGKDPLDGTTIEREGSYDTGQADLQGKKVGLIKQHFKGGLEPGVERIVKEAISKMEAAGMTVSEVSLPSLPLALAVYYIIVPAEISSNLSRYDGQRYGYSYSDAKNLDESYEISREKGFGAEAKRRIMIGTYVLSSGYYDAYYKKAQQVRTKVRQEMLEAFRQFDFLAGPTAPMTAFKIGEKTADPLQMYLTDIMTVGANITGNPAISLPAGESGGLPVGLQLIADYDKDQKLLSAAKSVEALL